MTGKIGVVGVGRIGLPVCARLAAARFEVIAADRRAEREAEVRASGAAWTADTDLLATEVEVLITVLPGPSELQDAMAGAIPRLAPGATWIDLTSSSPAVGCELQARALRRGVACLDAPIGGGIEAARAGTLQLFVGGPADTLARHRGLLEVLGTIEHLGDHGAGYTTKQLVNLLWFGQAVATGEALLLGQLAGIDLELLRSVLGRSAASSEFIRDLDALFDGDYLESFGIDRCSEELDGVIGLAHQLGVPFELSAQVGRHYRRAVEHYGPIDGELHAVALLEEQAGVRLRRQRSAEPPDPRLDGLQ